MFGHHCSLGIIKCVNNCIIGRCASSRILFEDALGGRLEDLMFLEPLEPVELDIDDEELEPLVPFYDDTPEESEEPENQKNQKKGLLDNLWNLLTAQVRTPFPTRSQPAQYTKS